MKDKDDKVQKLTEENTQLKLRLAWLEEQLKAAGTPCPILIEKKRCKPLDDATRLIEKMSKAQKKKKSRIVKP